MISLVVVESGEEKVYHRPRPVLVQPSDKLLTAPSLVSPVYESPQLMFFALVQMALEAGS